MSMFMGGRRRSQKEVEVGLYDSELAEIRSGLAADELVISTWSSQLYEGSTVNLKSEGGESAPAGKEPGTGRTETSARQNRAGGR